MPILAGKFSLSLEIKIRAVFTIFIKIFGEEFEKSAIALQILLLGIAVGSVSRVLSNDIAARGRPEINMYVALLTVAVNIICNIVLIPRIGINGAALATSISYFIGAIIKLIIYSKLASVLWYSTIIPTKTNINLLISLCKPRSG